MPDSLNRMAVLALALLVGMSADARPAASQASEFDWSEELPAGATLRVVTVAGDVAVEASPDGVARVRGRTRWSGGFGFGGDPEFRFEVLRDGADVTLCALDEGGSCDAEGLRSTRRDGGRDGRRDRRRARADFTVALPAGVAVRAGSGIGDVRVTGATAEVQGRTGNGEVFVGRGAERVSATSGNGDVEVEGARGPVEARSGNGHIVVSTALGPTNATTGNGSVEVSMASLPAAGDMSFRSGNGRITLVLPDGFSGEIEASTGNGGLESDFPIRMEGRIGRGRYRGTIGDGGRTVRIRTGNGRIELRRGVSGDTASGIGRL